jgi:hypothetical protein
MNAGSRRSPTFALTIFAVTIFAAMGCDSIDQNTPAPLVTTCPIGLAMSPQGQCCTGGSPGCPDPNALLDNSLKSAIQTGADNIDTAKLSLDSARDQLGVPKAAMAGNLNTPDSSAATAGPDSGAQASTDPASGGAPASGALGPGGPATPSGSDAPKDSGAKSRDLTIAPVEPSSAYSAGKGKPTAGGEDFAGFFGDLATGGSHEPAGGAAYRGIASVKTMGTPDPEDYFARLDLTDSIFKIVSRRLRTTARDWAETQSKADFEASGKAR